MTPIKSTNCFDEVAPEGQPCEMNREGLRLGERHNFYNSHHYESLIGF